MTHSIAFCSETAHPFFDRVLEGVQEEVEQTESVTLCGWMGSHRIPAAAMDCLNADGVITGILSFEASGKLALRVPMLGCSNARDSVSWPRIVNDDPGAGRLGVQTLADRGYGTLALVNTGKARHFDQRADGARSQARDIGLPVVEFTTPLRKPGKNETFANVWREQQAARRTFLKNLPENTGLLAVTSADAVESLDLLKNDLARSLPNDIGLLIADLPPESESHIAHVRLAAREIGRQAVRRLLQCLQQPGTPPGQDLSIAPEGIREGDTLRQDAATELYHRVEQCCRRHLRDEVTVDTLAAEIGLSRRSLEMKLHEAGLPPPYYLLTELRLQKARHLLETTPLRMDEIAEACGFNAARALTNRFRARHGMSPGQWRKTHS